ncbi:LMBR1 domain protein, putative (macronuclear) [Tetrahymena thermophila SB210]|uniref:LMBR1 domain protein, putative n=1 Tax=Tetrahymena thermophila (strain SB210) TaxID=312017 RepID=Q22W34_TETTS|nr:LMBR1 domain protein, putative [Tetrahymena thermophila SB210]EAR89583.2 LMBR1 domain protein, putative [Tetrahymena thermophila SB210]|eukprot:XP_001009828.2 LMBR1 domain protein, putative [Tetrahymena thermophila SB210]
MKQQQAIQIFQSLIKKRKNVNYIISSVTFLIVILSLTIAQNYQSYIASSVILSFSGSLIMLVSFCSIQSFEWDTYLTVFLGYFISFSTICIIPLDAALITYDKNSRNINLSKIDSSTDSFKTYWIVIYWTIFFLSNLVYTLQSFFHNNGYIGFKQKMRAAFKQFFKLVIACVALFIILSIICLFWFKIKGFDNILAVIVVISNVYGISVLAFLFGYGLVKVPFYLWNKSQREDYLIELLCKTHELFKEYQSSYWKYSDICYISSSYQKKIANIPIYLDYLKLIQKETPNLNEPIGYRFQKNILYKPDEKITEFVIKLKTNGQISEQVLASLRQEIRIRKFNYERHIQKWKRISTSVFSIITKESIEEIDQSLNIPRSSTSVSSRNSSREEVHQNAKPVKVKAIKMNIFLSAGFKLAAIIAGLFSILIIFCEATIVFGSQNKALAFYQMIKSTNNIPGIISLIILVLLYVIFCTYFALGKLKVFGSFELFIYFTHRDVFIQNLSMCLFLTFPICYNVMLLFGIIDQNTEDDGKVYQSGFDKFYDPMKEIPFFGYYYNAVVCFLISVIAIVSSFKKTQKLIQKFSQNKIQMQTEIEEDLILKGELYILQEWQRKKQAEQIQEIKDSTELDLPQDKQQFEELGQNVRISVSQYQQKDSNNNSEDKKSDENVFRKVSNFFKRISTSSKKEKTEQDANQSEKPSDNQELSVNDQQNSQSQSINISMNLSENDIQNQNTKKLSKNLTKK